MGFGNPYALWGLALIPIIILMYILKQNFEEKHVASTYLWDLATKEDEVNTPWQRLRKNLLLFLQILIVILLTAALSNPYIYRQDIGGKAEVIIIDTSASMLAKYNESGTRLDYAKKAASSLVDSLNKHTPVSIITVGQDVSLLLSGEDDQEEVKKTIRGIKPSYGADSVEDHLSFIQSIADNYEAYGIRVYSDTVIGGEGIHTHLVNRPDNNVSIDYMTSYIGDDELIEVLVKVTNRYDKKIDVQLGIYTEEDTFLKGVEVALNPRETKNILFDGISYDGKIIYGELGDSDLIDEDNKCYSVLRRERTKDILLVSEGNIFIEKSILATGRYELFKTNTTEVSEEVYDLYIFDGILPIDMPKVGNLLFLNLPSVDNFYDTGEEQDGGLVTFQEHEMTKYVKDERFVTSSYWPIKLTDDMITIAAVGGDSIISIGNNKGQRYGVLAFDIHSSDFPVSMSFPVVLDRLLGNILGDSSSQKTRYYPGDHIGILPLSTTVKAYMIAPNGKEDKLEITYPTTYYDKTDQLGIYKLIQEGENGETSSQYMVVGYNTKLESDIEDVTISGDEQVTKATKIRDIKTDLMNIIIIFAIILSLYEWKKYVRG